MSAVVILNGYAASAAMLDAETAGRIAAREDAWVEEIARPLRAKGLAGAALVAAHARAYHAAYGAHWRVWLERAQLSLFGEGR